jgi:hypothetical protein
LKKYKKVEKVSKSFIASIATSVFSLTAIIYYIITFSPSFTFFLLSLLAVVSFLVFGYFTIKEREEE